MTGFIRSYTVSPRPLTAQQPQEAQRAVQIKQGKAQSALQKHIECSQGGSKGPFRYTEYSLYYLVFVKTIV